MQHQRTLINQEPVWHSLDEAWELTGEPLTADALSQVLRIQDDRGEDAAALFWAQPASRRI